MWRMQKPAGVCLAEMKFIVLCNFLHIERIFFFSSQNTLLDYLTEMNPGTDQ